MKVVLDTNTIVSAIGWDGPPWNVLRSARDGPHELIISPALLAELARVLGYRKLRALASRPRFPVVLEWLHHPEHLVYPVESLNVITQDPPDNHVLEAAVAGRADVIVSGDHHLLALGSFREIPIISASEFTARYP